MDLRWLRGKTPRSRTSTWKPNSANAVLGEAGEVVVVGRVQNILERKGLKWKVGRTGSPNTGGGGLDDPTVPIENYRLGDVHVLDHNGRRRFSFEVKASMEYANATISERQLEQSDAEYFVGVTKAGLWVCSMDDVRRCAFKQSNGNGSFWVVPYNFVTKLNLEDLFPDV